VANCPKLRLSARIEQITSSVELHFVTCHYEMQGTVDRFQVDFRFGQFGGERRRCVYCG
jgi:hypothetical protein